MHLPTEARCFRIRFVGQGMMPPPPPTGWQQIALGLPPVPGSDIAPPPMPATPNWQQQAIGMPAQQQANGAPPPAPNVRA